ncbi:hypothetical protein P7K49_039631 [Saguinus oedipus]|uniref:Uncharacterized protein n=1 Tax=Saguinus oedipus TaxID=9490 RepID=A0ABQ9TBG6_SAGOE|nr:hypothetical protein P7K49_039631 [Saguinus oedipus]
MARPPAHFPTRPAGTGHPQGQMCPGCLQKSVHSQFTSMVAEQILHLFTGVLHMNTIFLLVAVGSHSELRRGDQPLWASEPQADPSLTCPQFHSPVVSSTSLSKPAQAPETAGAEEAVSGFKLCFEDTLSLPAGFEDWSLCLRVKEWTWFQACSEPHLPLQATVKAHESMPVASGALSLPSSSMFLCVTEFQEGPAALEGLTVSKLDAPGPSS